MAKLHPNFYTLCDRAESLMLSPSRIDWIEASDGFRTVLRIRNYPSFEPMIVWDVAVQTGAARDANASVCEMTWDRPGDALRFIDPLARVAHPQKLRSIPSLYLRQATFEASLILSQLERIDFRSFDAGIGNRWIWIDGDHYYVEARPDQEVLTFHWEVSSGPPEWRALISWTQHMTQFLLAQLSGSAACPLAIEE